MMEYGLQMYSVRDITKDNLIDALRQVAELGYRFVEFAGFFGNSAKDVRAALDANGLKVSGTHTGWVELTADRIDETIAYHKELGNTNIIIPGMPMGTEEELNKAIAASGILFGNATSDALRSLDEDTLLAVFDGVPTFEISREQLNEGVKAVDLTTEVAAVFASKGEMRKLVQGGGVSMNKEKLAAFDQMVTAADLLNDKYILIQKGKKNYFLLIAK